LNAAGHGRAFQLVGTALQEAMQRLLHLDVSIFGSRADGAAGDTSCTCRACTTWRSGDGSSRRHQCKVSARLGQ
jgi:hypothetical protein